MDFFLSSGFRGLVGWPDGLPSATYGVSRGLLLFMGIEILAVRRSRRALEVTEGSCLVSTEGSSRLNLVRSDILIESGWWYPLLLPRFALSDRKEASSSSISLIRPEISFCESPVYCRMDGLLVATAARPLELMLLLSID
jgi:hypothetical protein